MLEQEFEKLLAAYFEDELDEAGLLQLTESIQQTPSNRRRFQRELRLHTLMRETASVVVEREKQSPASAVGRFGWRRLAATAAVLILGVVFGQMILNQRGGAEKVGHCLQVSNSDEVSLVRGGKTLAVKQETVLRAGDRVLTGNQAQASLRLEGVGILTVQAQTEIEIAPPNETVAVSVLKGLVLVEASKRKEGMAPVVFRTPKAEVEVMGTVFGLEVDATATRVRVHEGQVRYAERSLDRSVEVEAGQYCVNGGSTLEARELSDLLPGALMPGQIRLQPIADAYSDRRKHLNDSYLKVEYQRRASYLKFEVPEGGRIVEAKLLMTQMVDPGFGTLRFWEASHNDWAESSLSLESAPEPGNLITERKGWVRLDEVVEVDVSSFVRSAGTHGLIITLEGEGSNDIWFGSKESPHPPQLILTREVN